MHPDRSLVFAWTDRSASPGEEGLAAEIAVYDISKPLGRRYVLLVEDADGVWWWGMVIRM